MPEAVQFFTRICIVRNTITSTIPEDALDRRSRCVVLPMARQGKDLVRLGMGGFDSNNHDRCTFTWEPIDRFYRRLSTLGLIVLAPIAVAMGLGTVRSVIAGNWYDAMKYAVAAFSVIFAVYCAAILLKYIPKHPTQAMLSMSEDGWSVHAQRLNLFSFSLPVVREAGPLRCFALISLHRMRLTHPLDMFDVPAAEQADYISAVIVFGESGVFPFAVFKRDDFDERQLDATRDFLRETGLPELQDLREHLHAVTG
jgi:hypothetical protein